MKQAVYLTPLLALAAAAGTAELNTMTIQNLPVSAEENRVVCYDSASGKLGNCPGRETSIAVDCNIPGATIKDAIEKTTTAAGVALTVNISGTCNETLEIERPNTQLLGDGAATIVGQNANLGAITVITSPVEMENLVVAGGTGPGITVWPGGSLFLNDVTITSGKTALSVVSGKAVLIQGNDVSTSGTDKHAVLVREGGNIYIATNNTLSSPTTFASTNATLGIYRGSTVTMQGDGNLISNTDTGADPLALKLTQGAHFRQEGGHSVLNGGVRLLNMSSADFRDVEINGDVFAKIFASLRFEDQDSDDLPTDTVSGNISIEHLANIDVKGAVSLDGNLSCSSGGTSSGATPTVTGSDDCYP